MIVSSHPSYGPPSFPPLMLWISEQSTYIPDGESRSFDFSLTQPCGIPRARFRSVLILNAKNGCLLNTRFGLLAAEHFRDC